MTLDKTLTRLLIVDDHEASSSQSRALDVHHLYPGVRGDQRIDSSSVFVVPQDLLTDLAASPVISSHGRMLEVERVSLVR